MLLQLLRDLAHLAALHDVPDVELTLTVVDCMGATDTDTVTVTYECTGS